MTSCQARAFWVGLFVYLLAVGMVGQPPVHDFYDEVAIRDVGTVWASLTWTWPGLQAVPAIGKEFGLVAVMRHMEGPLQFLLLNAWCSTIGTWLPLTPAVMAFPNVVLAWLSGWFLAKLARVFFAARVEACVVLVFALMPWTAIAVRRPELYPLLSCWLEAMTFYFVVAWVMEEAHAQS